MKSKIILIISFVIISFNAFCQKEIHFEQIAFDYFKDSILKNKEDKLTISKKIIEDASYWKVDCLKEFNITINDTAVAQISEIVSVDLKTEDDKRFKIKKFKQKNPPMVFATYFLNFGNDKNITAIVERKGKKYFTYLFEINQLGEIKKWCKGEVKRY
jgi:hypothetical protein